MTVPPPAVLSFSGGRCDKTALPLMLRHHHLGGWKGMASKLPSSLIIFMAGYSEDKDDRFSLTLTSWLRRGGWKRKSRDGGVTEGEREGEGAIKSEMGSPRPTHVLKPSLSKDGLSGGTQGKCRGVCVCPSWDIQSSMARFEDSLNKSFLSWQWRAEVLANQLFLIPERFPNITLQDFWWSKDKRLNVHRLPLVAAMHMKCQASNKLDAQADILVK